MGPILLLALILRVVGIGFGLPHIYHQDEPVIVNHAMAIGERGWNPHFFIIPPFTIYGSFILYGVLYAAMTALGIVHAKADFGIFFLKDPTLFYWSARFVFGALFGCATVWALGRIGTRRWGKYAGLPAAFFLSASLLHAQHGHYIYADIAVAFFTTLLFFKVVETLEAGSFQNFAISGILLGLATSCKYTAAYFTVPIVGLYIARYKGSSLAPANIAKLLTAALCALAIFFIVAPYTLINFFEFFRQMTHQSGSEDYQGLWHHLTHSLANGTSIPFLILSLWGLWMIRRSDKTAGNTLIAFTFVFYFINTFFGQPFSRYMMPMVPLLCLAAGYGWMQARQRLTERQLRILTIVVAVSLLAPTVYADVLFLRKDTRDIAEKWIYEHIPQGSTIVVDNRYHAPHLMQTIDQIREKAAFATSERDSAKTKRLDLMEKALSNKLTYRLFTILRNPLDQESGYLFQRPYVHLDINEFRKVDAGYLIVNYSEYHEEIEDFTSRMAGELELIASFSPFWDAQQKKMKDVYSGTSAPDSQTDLFSRKRLGPYLEIYKIK